MLDKVVQGFRYSYETIQSFELSDATRTVAEYFNFVLGIKAGRNLASDYYFKNREVSQYKDRPLWQQKAFKITDFLGNLSLVLGGLISSPMIAIGNRSLRILFTPEQLVCYFGQQGYLPGRTIYHSISSVAFLLGIPSILKTLYSIYAWINQRRQTASSKEKGGSVEKVVEKPTDTKKEEVIEKDSHLYKPLSVRKEHVYLTFKTVSSTAYRFLSTPNGLSL